MLGTRSLVCGGTMRVGVAMCDSSDGYSKPCWTGATASRRDPLAWLKSMARVAGDDVDDSTDRDVVSLCQAATGLNPLKSGRCRGAGEGSESGSEDKSGKSGAAWASATAGSVRNSLDRINNSFSSFEVPISPPSLRLELEVPRSHDKNTAWASSWRPLFGTSVFW
jgi:hypothetical protein